MCAKVAEKKWRRALETDLPGMRQGVLSPFGEQRAEVLLAGVLPDSQILSGRPCTDNNRDMQNLREEAGVAGPFKAEVL